MKDLQVIMTLKPSIVHFIHVIKKPKYILTLTLSLSRSHPPRTKESLHRHLMTTLIDRFLDGSKREGHNFIAWKTHFKRYCSMPAQDEKGLRSDFSFLERRGLLSVGQYSILNKIFQKFDPRAVSFINKVSEEMAALPSENKTGQLILFQLRFEVLGKFYGLFL